MTLLSVRDLTMHFPARRAGWGKPQIVHAVDGVSFSVNRGETLGLVGESGSGKSTIGRTILQLHRPTAGRVEFDGTDLTALRGEPMRRMRRRMQMIFQDPYASLDPRMRIESIVGEPIDAYAIARGRAKRERVRHLLQTVGLSDSFATRFPHELSGGQRQRVGIARALAAEPEFIVADEPVSALDVSIQAQIVNLLEELQDEMGLTYLLIAHDLAVVRHTADRIAVMYLGKIVEVAPCDELYDQPLHPYTQSLLSAVPIPDPELETRRSRIILKGDLPSPVSPPPGCRFHTRCPLREKLGNPEICSVEEPPIVEHSAQHWAACHFVPEQSVSRAARPDA